MSGDAKSEIKRLIQIEAGAKSVLEERLAVLTAKQERYKNPRPDDVMADLIKLSTEITADEAAVALAKRDYERAHAARLAAEDGLSKQERQQRRAALLDTLARHVRQADERYTNPLRAVLAFLEERAACVREVQQFNKLCRDGDEPIADIFEQMRFSAAVPDEVIEVEVERRVRPDNLRTWDTDIRNWPLEKTKEKQVAKQGRSRIIPTPLHQIFRAPALRPGESNFQVAGVERPGMPIDANGAEYRSS
jgi:hypothetical protein